MEENLPIIGYPESYRIKLLQRASWILENKFIKGTGLCRFFGLEGNAGLGYKFPSFFQMDPGFIHHIIYHRKYFYGAYLGEPDTWNPLREVFIKKVIEVCADDFYFQRYIKYASFALSAKQIPKDIPCVFIEQLPFEVKEDKNDQITY